MIPAVQHKVISKLAGETDHVEFFISQKWGRGLGKGIFSSCFFLSFKIFLLWVLLRASVMGVPLVQGKSAPTGYSPLAHKNTVLRDHCSKGSLPLKNSHLF